MENESQVFQKTYDYYLGLIKDVRLDSIANKLGATYEDNKIKIKFFNNEYTVSAEKISDSSGQRPSYDICVILSKYILLCPDNPPNDHEWVSYRHFKNSAPLVHNFRNNVEEAISSFYSGKLNALQKSSELLAAYPSSLDANYDFIVQIDALPLIPVVLLYNSSDEEFPATCSVMFESQAETYLDCECLAMLGRQLFNHLKTAQG